MAMNGPYTARQASRYARFHEPFRVAIGIAKSTAIRMLIAAVRPKARHEASKTADADTRSSRARNENCGILLAAVVIYALPQHM
jgi:hypothetical protein